MNKITHYSIESKGIKPLWKSPSIMGHFEPNHASPLVYLQKPKWVSQEQFEKIIKSIELNMKLKDFYKLFPGEIK